MSLRLRAYPEYKDSGVPWLGDVPTHWSIGPGLSAFRQRQEKNAGMVETTVLSLSYGRIVVKPPERLHGLVPTSFEAYQVVYPGDIIVRPTDLQNDWVSLRVGMARDRGIITSAYMCLRTTGRMTPGYGYLLLHTYDLKKVFYGLGSGLRQNLDFADLKRLPVPTPPAEEQSQIEGFLAQLDRRISRLIRAKRRMIELLNEQKQGIIHRAVTRGLDPSVRLKASGIKWLGDVPEHWERTRLKYTARVQTGVTLGKTYGAVELGSYPYLRVANVQDGYLNLKDVATVNVPAGEAAGCQLQLGDVLMTEGGDIDKLVQRQVSIAIFRLTWAGRLVHHPVHEPSP